MKPTKKLSKKRVAPVKKNPPLLVQPLPLMKLIKLLTKIIRYRNNGYSKEERSELGLDLIEFGTETLLEIGEDLDALVLDLGEHKEKSLQDLILFAAKIFRYGIDGYSKRELVELGIDLLAWGTVLLEELREE